MVGNNRRVKITLNRVVFKYGLPLTISQHEAHPRAMSVLRDVRNATTVIWTIWTDVDFIHDYTYLKGTRLM